MPKALTDGQVAAYGRDGFTGPVPALTVAEAAACLARIDAFEAETGEQASTRLRTKAHLLLPWINDLVRHPRVLDAVEDVLGADILCWGGGFFYKRGGTGSFVSWHQDTWYWTWQPKDAVTVWLALTDATEEMGCVHYLPGSHLAPITTPGRLAREGNLLTTSLEVAGGVDEARTVAMPLQCGQLSLHHERAVHGSAPNRTDRPRVGFSIQYVAPHFVHATGPKTSATLVRGEDRHGNFLPEPVPTRDFDPPAMAAFERCLDFYRSPDSPQHQVN
ncbi:MAG: phytanoyl-CoA dioxygenase family protein [Rhodospirillaceae bacterium]|nr:phytanoyl-CoA dioxygenase family protein [Rhodospirillaceae bacterium]